MSVYSNRFESVNAVYIIAVYTIINAREFANSLFFTINRKVVLISYTREKIVDS
jgi:hypothetical protein